MSLTCYDAGGGKGFMRPDLRNAVRIIRKARRAGMDWAEIRATYVASASTEPPALRAMMIASFDEAVDYVKAYPK